MPRKKENEFKATVKKALALRVGHRCSNPDCRLATAGPQKLEGKVTNLGKAAHITAAAEGGPRYDASLTPEQRSAIDNGIWLCTRCADHVDIDAERFPETLLKGWKAQAEDTAFQELQGKPSSASDINLIRFFTQCFERPAFQDRFESEGRMEAFDVAMTDTITAINTGSLYDRQGRLLDKAKGKAFLKNQAWKRDMDIVVDILGTIRRSYDQAVASKDITIHPAGENQVWYCIRYQSGIADKMNELRAEALRIFSSLCEQAGLSRIDFPRYGYSLDRVDEKNLDRAFAKKILAVNVERSPLLRNWNFGFRFDRKDIRPLSQLQHLLDDPTLEFLDPSLERLRRELKVKLSHFCQLLGLKTAPVHGLPGVNEALPFEDDDHIGFWKTKEELNRAAMDTDKHYTELVKTIRRTLGVQI